MRSFRIFQVDAFTSKVFGGNPAAVCPLEEWLTDNEMQAIAAENNLAETAFFVLEKEAYSIRWFTPLCEVDLCGHATLASAHVLFEHERVAGNEIIFDSKSGKLKVTRDGEILTLDFPKGNPSSENIPPALEMAIGVKPIEYYISGFFGMAVLEREEIVRNIQPDFMKIKALDVTALIITSPGDSVDFVSRVFVPKAGIDEDPVTGSAYTVLTPYWSEVLNKKKLNAIQLSQRQGLVEVEDKGARTLISGQAITYMIGTIFID